MTSPIPASRIIAQDIWLPTAMCDQTILSSHERGFLILIVTIPISLLIVGVILPLLYLHFRSNKAQNRYCQLCSSIGDRSQTSTILIPTSSFDDDDDRVNLFRNWWKKN
ncbi:hypothetical protein DFH28DRAFT_1022338 [Melampsora americana]|nr:hypothetical protein DFH28DRAFT_1022338 [Melampsora americana]